MKRLKRSGIYKATNVSFDPNKIEAFSYGWWRFVSKVDGLVIFNNYRYSNTTARHQYKVRNVMENLGIKIDISMPLPRGIKRDQTLSEMIEEAEIEVCDQILNDILKKQERYQRTKYRKAVKRLEDYLENVVHFRDYDIKPKSQFGTVNVIAVHQCVDAETLENDVENALHNFSRDGFSRIFFYVEGAQ